MRKKDHVDPEYTRWRRKYGGFPGVEECARLIVEGKASGSWADIIAYELADNAGEHLEEMIEVFRSHESESVKLHMMMALDIAALPDSVDFLAEVLRNGREEYIYYAQHALKEIDTKESRTALFEAVQLSQDSED